MSRIGASLGLKNSWILLVYNMYSTSWARNDRSHNDNDMKGMHKRDMYRLGLKGKGP